MTAPMLIAMLKIVKPRVRRASSLRRIERANLGGDVALQQTRTHDQQQQGEQEGSARRPLPGALRSSKSAPITTALRCPIQRSAMRPPSSGVKYTKPVYRPKICDASAWVESGPDDGFDGRAKLREPGDVLDVAGQQHLVHHVQHHSAVIP